MTAYRESESSQRRRQRRAIQAKDVRDDARSSLLLWEHRVATFFAVFPATVCGVGSREREDCRCFMKVEINSKGDRLHGVSFVRRSPAVPLRAALLKEQNNSFAVCFWCPRRCVVLLAQGHFLFFCPPVLLAKKNRHVGAGFSCACSDGHLPGTSAEMLADMKFPSPCRHSSCATVAKILRPLNKTTGTWG